MPSISIKLLLVLLVVGIGAVSAGADEATRLGIHTVSAISPEAANLSVVQQAIIHDAHVVHFDLRTSDSGEIVVFKETSLRAALSVTRDKIFVDLTIDGIDIAALMTVLREMKVGPQVIVHATDAAQLAAVRAADAEMKTRTPIGVDSTRARELGASILTLPPDAVSGRAVKNAHGDGLDVWVDTGADGGARDDAIDAEVDYLVSLDLGGTVALLRDAGYYAARPLGKKWPVAAGKELSLVGTRWKRGKHTLIFHEEPDMAVKGGIVDRFFRNGVKGEYALDAAGNVSINVKGRKGSGTFDGSYLQTDGVECVRVQP